MYSNRSSTLRVPIYMKTEKESFFFLYRLWSFSPSQQQNIVACSMDAAIKSLTHSNPNFETTLTELCPGWRAYEGGARLIRCSLDKKNNSESHLFSLPLQGVSDFMSKPSLVPLREEWPSQSHRSLPSRCGWRAFIFLVSAWHGTATRTPSNTPDHYSSIRGLGQRPVT